MAIYHLNLKVGSRSGGQSARAKSEYIEREGKYEKDHEELEYRESGNMPSWAADDPRAYWSAADEHERANGRLFVQVECSLPKELNEQEQRKLAQGFAEELTGQKRLPYTLAIHKGGGENPHIHLMISERGLDGHDRDAEQWFKRANTKEPEKGGAKKTSLSSKEWLAATRQRWETATNRALDRAGSAERIDHRSLAAQREEAIERGQVERAAELNRIPRNVPGPEAHRAQRGGPSRVVELDERAGHSNAQARAERAEANGQVDRAAAVFRERGEQMKAQLKALDTEIRATRLAVLKEAGRRGIAQVAGIGGKVAAQVKNIIETPGRAISARLEQRRQAKDAEAAAAKAELRALKQQWDADKAKRAAEKRQWDLDAPKREAEATAAEAWEAANPKEAAKQREKEEAWWRERKAKWEQEDAEQRQRAWELAHPEEAAKQRAEAEVAEARRQAQEVEAASEAKRQREKEEFWRQQMEQFPPLTPEEYEREVNRDRDIDKLPRRPKTKQEMDRTVELLKRAMKEHERGRGPDPDKDSGPSRDR